MADVEEKLPKSIEDHIERSILEKRRVFLSDAVDSDSARMLIRKLWYLDHLDPGKPILFVINSPGGSVDAGLAIWDQIKMLRSPVWTLVTGLAASMGSVLSLVAGKGRRLATPNSRIMIHQPRIGGVIRGAATDLDIQAQEILKTRAMLVELYVDATGKDTKTIERALDRDTWMSAEEALAYGLLDKVVTTGPEIDKIFK